MRKLITSALAATLLLSAISSVCLASNASEPQYDGPPPSDRNPDFTLHNDAHRNITNLYLMSREDADWGQDVLGEYVVRPGQSTKVSPGYHCHYNMKIVMDGGNSFTWNHVNFCSVDKMSIYWDNGTMHANYN